jgi:hypothetical protein
MIVLKPGQIIKNQQSPPQNSFMLGSQNFSQSHGAGQVGVNIGSKEKVMIDQRTYKELMSFIIKSNLVNVNLIYR